MARRVVLFGGAFAVATACGCAGTWDVVSSHKFRDNPLSAFRSEDPMTVLRTRIEGNERADAMRRLKEPAANGKTPQEQDEALQVLGAAATSDPSPIVRTAAIDALGRFQDQRAVKLLIAAYHQADGLATDPVRGGGGGVQQAAAFRSADATDPLSLLGPAGFEPAFVNTLRSRTVTALSKTGQPEAVTFLAGVAASGPAKPGEASTVDRDVRAAAVRGLGTVRSREAVAALGRVLQDEAGRDVVLAQNAHEGLVQLTGKNLPPDPAQWAPVIQAGGDVAPPPNMIQRAINTVVR